MQVRVVLDTPFAMLSSAPRSIARPVLQAVVFAPHLNALADEAVATMHSRTGSEAFNGMHLRIEADAQEMHEWRSGSAAVEVRQAMQAHVRYLQSRNLHALGVVLLSFSHSSRFVTRMHQWPGIGVAANSRQSRSFIASTCG